MTAAKVMDVRARRPGCAGQASDAVSAYTQVTMDEASTLLSLHPGRIIYGQSYGSQWGRMRSWRKSKSGLKRSSILKTHENCEGSISSTPRIRNSRKPSRTHVRSWKHQLLLLCPVKLWKIVGVVHPTKFRQNLRVFWKLMNPQECVWEIRYRSIMNEDHIAGKGENSLQHYDLVHKFIPMPQAMKIPAAKAAVDKEWEKLEKISAWNLTKVKSKKQVIDEARTAGATVHFASLMDRCHLKNAELEAKHQKYKGWVVLRGDIVKDNSGSYAVFTEQGSSASQMTAAKIMDIISRLPGCDGQAADAVSADTQVKLEDAHKLLKFQNRNAQTFGFVYHDTSCSNHGPAWKAQSFFLSDICTGIFWQDNFGKGNSRKFYWNTVGWSSKLGMFICRPRKRTILVCVCGRHKKLAGKKQDLDSMWKLLNKEVDLGEPTSFLDHVYLGCSQRQREISKDIVDNYRTMF